MTIPTDVFSIEKPQTYEALRSQIQNGDILLFSGTEMFSHLIRWATKSPWSHVGFIFRLQDIDRVMVLESVTGAGAHTVALSAMVNGSGAHQKPYKGGLLIARHADFATLSSSEKLRAMSLFAVDRFGSPYNIGEIIKVGLRIIAGWFNVKMPPLLKPDDEYICSEYAAACYAAIGINIPWDGLGFVAPCDFALDPKVSIVGVVETLG